MRRPLAVMGGSFFGTLILQNYLGFDFGFILGIISLTVSVLLLYFYNIKIFRQIAVFSISVFLACLLFCLNAKTFVDPVVESLKGQTLDIKATIYETEQNYGDVFYYVAKSDIKCSDGETREVKFRFSSTDRIGCEPYDVVEFTASFDQIDGRYASSYYADNIFVKAKAKSDIKVTRAENRPLRYHLLRFRTSLIQTVNHRLGDTLSGFMIGISTGDKSYMTSEVAAAVKNTGMSHITAVSGLHITIIAGILVSLLRYTRLNKRLRYLITLAPVWAFTIVAGLPYSAIRAAIMFTFMTVAHLVFMKVDSINSLFASLIFCGIISPYSAADVGLLASASATLGLVVLHPVISEYLVSKLPERLSKISVISHIINSFSQTASASIGLIPCCILFFQSFTPVAFLANLIVLPLVTVCLFCTLSAGCLCGIPLLCYPLLFVGGLSARVIIALLEFLSRFPFATVDASQPYLIVWLLICSGTFAISYLIIKLFGKQKVFLIASVIVCVVSLICTSAVYKAVAKESTDLYVIDNGDNLSVALVDNNAMTLICDSIDYEGVFTLRDIMYKRGIATIESVILTGNLNRFTSKIFNERLAIKKLYTTYDIFSKLPDEFETLSKDVSPLTETVPLSDTLVLNHDRVVGEMTFDINDFSVLICRNNVISQNDTKKAYDLIIGNNLSQNQTQAYDSRLTVFSCDKSNATSLIHLLSHSGKSGLCTASQGSVCISIFDDGTYTTKRIIYS